VLVCVRRESRTLKVGASHDVGLLTGAPLIDSALATLEAEVHDTADGGDHLIVIGRVLELRHTDDHLPPLLFYRGTYTKLAPANLTSP
jgi:3-hydroxy-9,10-secoandrosta-1,3,5(10)-triene-9,17-dione monooxygenase reductase component